MRFRGALLTLYVVPVVVGLFLMARGAWVPDGAECPGVTVDDESGCAVAVAVAVAAARPWRRAPDED
ncbi:hypothetical protein [Streptomyces sp. NBC_00316]|uniref:hypothetical protein n=1 Tax=Streptomyces sp. NBC_00316 TaxID=2975710 RepID=UPI002E27B0F8|nr:hypothetical protein [Streptomyces sp. NBC_00316]